MRVCGIKARTIFDSRGELTLEIELEDENGRSFSAAVPAGKSKGGKEAVVQIPEKAKEAVESILKKSLVGKTFLSIQEFDTQLLELDESKRKEVLGGNVVLGASLAAARGIAFEKKQELWELLREEFFKKEKGMKPPLIFSNMINGGIHTKSPLDIQEYMVVAFPAPSLQETVQNLIFFYEKIGVTLKERFQTDFLAIGDEDGYVGEFQNNREPLEILSELLLKEKHQYSLALDVAASTLRKGNTYFFEEKALSSADIMKQYQEYFSAFPQLISIEDPFAEDDVESFQALLKKFPDKWIVADDLSVTDKERIEELGEKKAMNAMVAKPNQVGTVLETCQAIQAAKGRGMKVIVSHRSGETKDAFLVAFARAANADAVKIGAPAQERLLKFNELLRLYTNG
tara:strand:- start:340 stop:1539 length:1200 start_codon:yes stop_codon:yes gene_type:complete